MMEKDNANPTILNTSQLPTRQNKRKAVSREGPTDKLGDLLLQRPHYLSTPFFDVPWSEDTDDSNEFTAEPIDEQEIFGKPKTLFMLPLGLVHCTSIIIMTIYVCADVEATYPPPTAFLL